ncbi:MAG TPA: hypothetical protein VF571_17570 [Pyrinomonadaceae bacterium]|jgi:hypothetical protein
MFDTVGNNALGKLVGARRIKRLSQSLMISQAFERTAEFFKQSRRQRNFAFGIIRDILFRIYKNQLY